MQENGFNYYGNDLQRFSKRVQVVAPMTSEMIAQGLWYGCNVHSDWLHFVATRKDSWEAAMVLLWGCLYGYHMAANGPQVAAKDHLKLVALVWWY